MPAATICTCTLSLKDQLGVAPTNAELVCYPKKSFIQTATTNALLSAPKRVTADANGLCTIALAETTTSGQKVVFQVIYIQNAQPYEIIFEPILIPNAVSVDLSTLLTPSRG